MKKQLKLIILITLLIPCMMQVVYGAGVTSADFLLVGVGARAQGMGKAFTALSDDVNSVYWNQAGLGFVDKPQMSFMHNAWLDNISYDYFAAGVPTRHGTFGLSIHHLNYGDIIGRESQIGDEFSFSAYNSMVTIGFGKKVSGRMNFGFNLKYITEKIEDVTATGIAADLGMLYLIPQQRLSLGFAVQNISNGIKYVEETEQLPLNISAGVGYYVGGMNLGIDFRHYVYDKMTDICIGTEVMPISGLAVRGGLLYNVIRQAASADVGATSQPFSPSGGIGLKIGSSQVDYSLTPFNDLGTTHKLSLTVGF